MPNHIRVAVLSSVLLLSQSCASSGGVAGTETALKPAGTTAVADQLLGGPLGCENKDDRLMRGIFGAVNHAGLEKCVLDFVGVREDALTRARNSNGGEAVKLAYVDLQAAANAYVEQLKYVAQSPSKGWTQGDVEPYAQRLASEKSEFDIAVASDTGFGAAILGPLIELGRMVYNARKNAADDKRQLIVTALDGQKFPDWRELGQ